MAIVPYSIMNLPTGFEYDKKQGLLYSPRLNSLTGKKVSVKVQSDGVVLSEKNIQFTIDSFISMEEFLLERAKEPSHRHVRPRFKAEYITVNFTPKTPVLLKRSTFDFLFIIVPALILTVNLVLFLHMYGFF